MARVISPPATHPAQVRLNLDLPIQYLYYAFVFSLPFQTANAGLSRFGTISKLIGYAFMAMTLTKPKLCYKRPTSALYCFSTYLVVFAFAASFGGDPANSFDFVYFLTLVQLVVLFWVSANLFCYDGRIIRRTLFAFAMASVLLAIAMVFGLAGEVVLDDRATAFDANPNAIAEVLMLGLLALAGLAYGQQKSTRKARAGFWLLSAFLFLSVVRTGSRGAVVALLAGLMAFLFKRTSLTVRAKLALAVLASTAFIAVASNSIESVAERWRQTLVEGDTAGRDEIYVLGWQMFMEKPVLGWGADHQNELGARLGLPTRDFHNIYLHLLTQVGIVGAIPFFIGLGLCGRSAWKARNNMQGVLPLAMLVSLSIMSFTGTTISEKWLWVFLAYATAAGTYPAITVHKQRSAGVPPLHVIGGDGSANSRNYQSLPVSRFVAASRRPKVI